MALQGSDADSCKVQLLSDKKYMHTRYKMQESLLQFFGINKSTYRHGISCDRHKIIQEKKSKYDSYSGLEIQKRKKIKRKKEKKKE